MPPAACCGSTSAALLEYRKSAWAKNSGDRINEELASANARIASCKTIRAFAENENRSKKPKGSA